MLTKHCSVPGTVAGAGTSAERGRQRSQSHTAPSLLGEMENKKVKKILINQIIKKIEK